MSQRVVAYEGEGRSRRPVYADEGRAAAAVGDPVAALGVLSVTGFHGDESGVPTGGAGPVERRFITQAELAARVAPRPTTPAVTTHHEEPAMAATPHNAPPLDVEVTEGPHVALGRLARAAQDAAEAFQAKAFADMAWRAAQDALESAWLEVKGTDAPASLNGAGQITISGRGNTPAQSRANGTAAMLARRAPKRAPKGPSKHGTATDQERADRARTVLEVLERHGGDTKAAGAELGMRGNVVGKIASAARARQAADGN